MSGLLGPGKIERKGRQSLEIGAEEAETAESMSDLTGHIEIVGRRTDEEKGKYGS